MSDPYELAPEPPPPPMEVMPVEPIEYSIPAQGGRPGLVTAIGVTSIVLASLSIFGGGVMSLWMMLVVSFVGMAARMPVAAPVPPPPIVVPLKTQELVGDHGMASDQRRIVLDGLSQVRALTDQRRRLVDELLAQDGTEIVLLTGDSLTADRVAANVSDSGRLLSSRGGDDGPEYFVVGSGKIEVDDDHAAFFATDGSPPVRVTADSLLQPGAAQAPSGLTEQQIQGIIRRVNRLGGQMTPSQIQALAQTLRNPGEQFVVPTINGADPATEIIAAISPGDGSVIITSSYNGSYSSMTFASNGQMTNSMTSNRGTYNYNVVAGTNNPFGKISPMAPLMIGLNAIASFALSVYLLISGIMVLRQSPRGATLHWIYVAIKILVEILVGVALWWFFSQMLSGNGGAARRLGAITGVSSVAVVLGCIYPIVLVFVLCSRTVREYYSK